MKISESGKSKKKWLIVALAIVLVIGIFAAIGVMNGSQEEPEYSEDSGNEEDQSVYSPDSANEEDQGEVEEVEADSDYSDFVWMKNETGEGIVIYGYNGEETEVQIPAEIDGMSVTEIGEKAFYINSFLTAVNLPDSIVKIGKDAFNGCFNLAEVNLPDSVAEIGEYAFCGCSSLIEVNLPDSVAEIGSSTFLSCTSLTKVDLPDGLNKIGMCAFSWCENLREIDFQDCSGLQEIGMLAFSECGNLGSISVPQGCKVEDQGENSPRIEYY